ncbi:MAG TPA: isocitrate lyase/PEP mutase family protein [Chloroflexota bacterium]|nr:isocitrate lyase/PEP mutase family protein [Chloroflexota bacterium]
MSDLLSQRRGAPKALRDLLADAEPVLAPGAYDALSARLIESAGFPAVYMTGFGTSASYLGRPDVGLMTMAEMVDQARRIVQAVGVPVIADADTGYGNPINVIRTVQAYENAGVAAIHIEDQVAPKRCGHMEGKQVIPAEDMVQKVRAAVAAKSSPDFTLIARTDARAVEGFQPALDRVRRYRDAGADIIFFEAPQTEAEVATIAEEFRGTPLMFNWAEGGKTPPVPLSRLRELNYRIVIFPVTALLAATRAVQDALTALRRDGTPPMEHLVPFPDFLDAIGLPEIRDLEQRFQTGIS